MFTLTKTQSEKYKHEGRVGWGGDKGKGKDWEQG